jgi:hypothetical protein
MDVPLLIDAIVRQTTVLIAQLATVGGTRAPLARTANQVFVSLVQELKQQGLGSKVIADMFGLALRTYHNRVQRLSESATFRGRSIWEAVLDHVQEYGPVLRAEVLRRFSGDEEELVRAVLTDLVDSQLLTRTGRGDSTTYRAATDADRVVEDGSDQERLSCLLWVALHRYGPIDVDGLLEFVPAPRADTEAALAQLVSDGRATLLESAGKRRYQSLHYLIPVGHHQGWEAAVFDHYQALVTAICQKVQSAETRSTPDDWVGGSTYCFDVSENHPLHHEVAGFLKRLRAQAVELRERVERHNREHGEPGDHERRRFTTYIGQTFVSAEAPEPNR